MRVIFVVLSILVSASFYGQDHKNPYTQKEKSAISTVNAQLKAYNSQDLESFLALFSEDVKVFNYPNEVRKSGKAELREMYAEFFTSAPNLNSEITNRIVIGNKVIDHEKVTGFSADESEVLLVTAIYTVKNDLITEMRFIYP